MLCHCCSDPNQGEGGATTPKLPTWSRYTVNERNVQVLDTGSNMETQLGLQERECDYWFNVVPQLQAAAAGGPILSCLLITVPIESVLRANKDQ
jgi:hypothetical protein